MSGAPPGDRPNGLLGCVRQRRRRYHAWLREGEPSVARYIGQIGVLGWIIVTPALLALFAGRWLDRQLGSGIFWSAPLLMIGMAVGFWSAWKWMHAR